MRLEPYAMNLVFYRTTDVFEAEERFQEHGIAVEIVPTPVQDKAYCGVCIYIKDTQHSYVKEILDGLEYKTII